MRLTRERTIWMVVAAAGMWLAWSATAREPVPSSVSPVSQSPARFFAFRLRPGQDLRKELLAVAKREGLRAGAIVTCVGSLTDVSLRLANRQETTTRTGHFEIVSLVGTLDMVGGHLHLCVADREGVAFGGHLMDGCLVYTTAEIVLTDLTGLEFRREPDKTFGYNELAIYPRLGVK